MKIMKSSTLRLTNIAKSNDSEEIRYCSYMLYKTLQQSCYEFANQLPSEEGEIKESIRGIEFEKLVKRAVLNESLVYYAVCFCTDWDLLSQWRGYADDGKGVAIGFRTKVFCDARDPRILKFDKVQYGTDEMKKKWHDRILEKLNRALNSRSDQDLIIRIHNAINEILSLMVYWCVFIKNPAFKEEREYRLVFYPFGGIRNLLISDKLGELSSKQLFYDRMQECIDYEKDHHGLIREKLSFRCTSDSIVSYSAVNFSHIKKDLISEVVIGPKARIDDSDLRMFLISLGYGISNNGLDNSHIYIRKSDATYQ